MEFYLILRPISGAPKGELGPDESGIEGYFKRSAQAVKDWYNVSHLFVHYFLFHISFCLFGIIRSRKFINRFSFLFCLIVGCRTN